MLGRDVGESGQSSKPRKRDRKDNDGSRFPTTKLCKDEPTEEQGQRNLSKTKCYNYGQMGHIKA